MPRTYGKSKGRAKQTRLSFVPTEFTNSQNEEANRNANVRYAHPSLSTLRSPRKARDKSSTPTPVNLEPSPEEALQSTNDQSSQRRSRRKGKKGTLSGNNYLLSGLICIAASQMSASQHATSPSPPPATQDSDSDLEIVHSARKNTRAGNTKRKRVDSSESEGSHISDESDADEVVARPRRKLRRGGAPQPIVVDDDSEEQEVRAGASHSPDIPHTPRRDSAQDRIDLDEDLEDLQDSGTTHSVSKYLTISNILCSRQNVAHSW